MANYRIKLVIAGESCAGKSSLITQYVDGKFYHERCQTIGLDFKLKTFTKDGNHYRLQLWDTAGQERFRSIIQAYYRCADIVVVAFDLTGEESLNRVEYWVEEIMKLNPNLSKDQMIIAGCKSDLKDYLIHPEHVHKKIDHLGIQYFPLSAKTGEGVQEAFQYLIQNSIKDNNAKLEAIDPDNKFGFTSSSTNGTKSSSSCCRLI